MEEETIEGIEKQYSDVVHYVEDTPAKPNDKNEKEQKKRKDESVPNEPRLISSRGSSRMLFADLNIEDIQ